MAVVRGQIYQGGPLGASQVEVLIDGPAALSADGQALVPLKENTTDGAKEKHVPVIEKVPGGYKVKVGSVPHPMVDDHWIVWIEVTTKGDQVLRQYRKPGDAPEATFQTADEIVEVREFCNKHGLWKA